MPNCSVVLISLLLIVTHDALASVTGIYTIRRYPPAVQTPDIAI